MCALVNVSKRAAQTADSGTSSRRRRGEVPTSQRSANDAAKRQSATMATLYRQACTSALPCWRLDVAALVHSHRHAGASAFLRWRMSASPRSASASPRSSAPSPRWRDVSAHAQYLKGIFTSTPLFSNPRKIDLPFFGNLGKIKAAQIGPVKISSKYLALQSAAISIFYGK
jgi:hypothetical protein